MTSRHAFDEDQRQAVYRAIHERRDMRHFRPGPVEASVLQRLLEAAHAAPSVGLMQPWRFLRITDLKLRKALHAQVEEERQRTAEALGEQREQFLRLKVEGVLDCGELLVAALMPNRTPHLFGRRTMPYMDLASVSCAIQNLWLAARAEGLGMGWVSLFDPEALAQLLKMPEGAEPVAILCLGQVDEFYPRPMLVEEGWAEEQPLSELLMENYWPEDGEAES